MAERSNSAHMDDAKGAPIKLRISMRKKRRADGDEEGAYAFLTF